MKKYKVLIIGAGLSALSTAARLTELGISNIGVYGVSTGGTPYIAAINFALDENPSGDSTEKYFTDMLNAGYQIGNRELVYDMAANSPKAYDFLLRWGIKFSRKEDGSLLFRHLSGHSVPRSLCCTSQLIGIQMLNCLSAGLKEKGVNITLGYECVGLSVRNNRVNGALFKTRNNKQEIIQADYVVAAWGGVGHLLGVSTYPDDIRGNTVAIAHSAGCKLVDLEFIEYEPMVVDFPKAAEGEPCPTAMLGEGAYLLNSKMERFLLKDRPQGEAGAPKSLINRLIWKEVQNGNGSPNNGVFVDLRHISLAVLKSYPWFYNRLIKSGLDPKKELVDVKPMAHSFSGGIHINKDYMSAVDGLYAVGEACGGVHGACRCAGNAASQAVVSAYICANKLADRIQRNPSYCSSDEISISLKEDLEVRKDYLPGIVGLGAKALGVYRDGASLEQSLNAIKEIQKNLELDKDDYTKQIAHSIELILIAALERRESRGTNLRTDFPDSDPLLCKSNIF